MNEKQTKYQSIHANAVELNVQQNKFTNLTLDDLAKCRQKVLDVIQHRNRLYESELQKQKMNDQYCKHFAGLVDPFVKAIGDAKDEITASKKDLEEQLMHVKTKLSEVPTEQTKLEPIRVAFAKMEAEGITNNRYTTFTSKDVEVQFEQYKNFLEKKIKMLEEEIEHNKLRGITPEQFNEIDTTFKQFDSDKSGFIDKKELKTCLYSLGEEKSRAEVDAIMKKYGSPDVNGINYASFREFIIDLLGVSDTKDDIIGSFKLINRGAEASKMDNMELVMKDEDIKYFTDSTKKNADGTYDYSEWTRAIFSR